MTKPCGCYPTVAGTVSSRFCAVHGTYDHVEPHQFIPSRRAIDCCTQCAGSQFNEVHDVPDCKLCNDTGVITTDDEELSTFGSTETETLKGGMYACHCTLGREMKEFL